MVRWLVRVVVVAALGAQGLGCGCARRAPRDQASREERRVQVLHVENSALAHRWHVGAVCIDPGHGGRDSGTLGADGTLEKTLVLDIARRVRDGLVAEGAVVVMTREDDRFVALARRAAICNDAGAGLFVSIHANGFYEPDVHGFELYYFNGCASDEAPRAAEAIRQAIAAATDARDRGVRRADFSVLAATRCPAVLVEVGYLSNPDEAERLADADYRQDLADAIVGGIVAFGAEATSDSREAQP